VAGCRRRRRRRWEEGGGCGDEEVMAKAMAGNGGVAVEMEEATCLQVCRGIWVARSFFG
jgi:hypothetical protein